MRASMESTDLRTSSGEEEAFREAEVVSLRVDLIVVDSFSTWKCATLKFFRRSSKGSRRRGWSRIRCVSGLSLEVMWSAILVGRVVAYEVEVVARGGGFNGHELELVDSECLERRALSSQSRSRLLW